MVRNPFEVHKTELSLDRAVGMGDMEADVGGEVLLGTMGSPVIALGQC